MRRYLHALCLTLGLAGLLFVSTPPLLQARAAGPDIMPAAALIAAQPSPEIEDPVPLGMVVTGPVTFDRNQQNQTVLFSVADVSGTLVDLRFMTRYAFPADETVIHLSAIWARQLVRGGTVALRFADKPWNLQPGDTVPADALNDKIAECLAPTIYSRDSHNAAYVLRCVDFHDSRRIENDGKFVYELDVVVMTPNQFPLDSFFGNYTEKMIFLRLEDPTAS